MEGRSFDQNRRFGSRGGDDHSVWPKSLVNAIEVQNDFVEKNCLAGPC